MHFVDLALWYARENGKPTRLRAAGTGRRAADGLFDTLTLELFWEDGSVAIISQCLSGFEHHLVLEITGSEGGRAELVVGRHGSQPDAEFRVEGQAQGARSRRDRRRSCRSRIRGKCSSSRRISGLRLQGFRENRSILPPEEARASIAICLAAAGGGVERQGGLARALGRAARALFATASPPSSWCHPCCPSTGCRLRATHRECGPLPSNPCGRARRFARRSALRCRRSHPRKARRSSFARRSIPRKLKLSRNSLARPAFRSVCRAASSFGVLRSSASASITA